MSVLNDTIIYAACAPYDPDGNKRVEWLFVGIGACVRGPLEQLSFVFGITSLLMGIITLTPQFYINYRKQSGDAISPLLLFNWTLGGVFNLVGAILTSQLYTQILEAAYFVAVDVLLIIQVIYYKIKNAILRKIAQKNVRLLEPMTDSEEEPDIGSQTTQLQSYLALAALGFLTYTSFVTMSQQENTIYHIGRRLLNPTKIVCGFFNSNHKLDYPDHWPPVGGIVITGYVLGWGSAACYFIGRIPQIIKNLLRRQTDGLSLGLFIMSMFGNFTYVCSIITYSTRGPFLLAKLPWIVGASGAFLLDSVIMLQFFIYRKKKTKESEIENILPANSDLANPLIEDEEKEKDEVYPL